MSSEQGQRLALAFQGLLVLGVAAALTVQQLQYRDSWDRECDFNAKMWSTVWLSRALTQYVLLFVTTYFVMKQIALGLAGLLRGLQCVISLFKCVWFFIGIRLVLREDHCGSVAGTWGTVLWWLELATLILPCLCICCVFPCCLACISAGKITMENPTPEEVRNKLKPQRYSEFVRAPAVESTPPQPSPVERGGIYPDMASTVIGIPIPGASKVGHLPVRTVPESRPGDCAVCLCHFEPQDAVVEFPCPSRHLFHGRCVLEWLAKTQGCPVCNTNVVHALETTSSSESVILNRFTTRSAGNEKAPQIPDSIV